MNSTKVFGIGFHKTGTTSLGLALEILNYRVTGPNWTRERNVGENILARAMKHARHYDAFQDNPWPVLFKDMDRAFPGSKFVLTIRSTDSWIKSVVKYCGGDSTPMREWIYGIGDPIGNEDLYAERFEAHNREVMAYFRNRQNELLVLDLTKDQGWVELCGFLNVSAPPTPFPRYVPVAGQGRTAMEKMKARLGSYGYRFRRLLSTR